MWTFPFILMGLSTMKFNYVTGSHLMAVMGLGGQQLTVTSSPTKYLQFLDCCNECSLSRRSVKVFLIPVNNLSYWVISFLITSKSSAQLGLTWVCWSFLPDEPNGLVFLIAILWRKPQNRIEKWPASKFCFFCVPALSLSPGGSGLAHQPGKDWMKLGCYSQGNSQDNRVPGPLIPLFLHLFIS